MDLKNWFTRKDEDGYSKIRLSRVILAALGVFLFLVLFFGSFFIVGAGERGVVFNSFTGIKQWNYDEGLHLKIPLFEKAYKFEVRTTVYNADANSASKDLQIVHTAVALNYHLDPSSVYVLFGEIGEDYEERIIRPSIQEVVKSVTAKYIAEDMIKNREAVKNDIREHLKTRLADSYIVMDDLSITNFDFSEELNKAIESKVSAEQNALREQNNLRVVQFQAQQKVEAARGEAESIRIINAELDKSPQYVNLLMIQKWNGVMPLALGSNTLLSITGGK